MFQRNGVPMAKQAKQAKQLDDLFEDLLKDIYYAEKKILTALPKMAKGANCDKLKSAFEEHLEQTKGHVTRLEEILEAEGKSIGVVILKAIGSPSITCTCTPRCSTACLPAITICTWRKSPPATCLTTASRWYIYARTGFTTNRG